MKSTQLIAAALLVGFASGWVRGEQLPAEMVEARSEYEARVVEAREPLEELKVKYLAALEGLAEREQAAGRLESLLETRRVAEAARAGQPADPPANSEEVQRLEEIYMRERARLEAEMAQQIAPAMAAYRAAIEGVVALLTREGRLEEALRVREELERLPVAGADAGAAAASALSPSESDPGSATSDRPFANSLGMQFVPVPGTEVLFCIHPTRYRDYAAYAEANPEAGSQWKEQAHESSGEVDRADEHPVVNVSWDDAVAFCEWLSQSEGRRYRLPTDAEWSLAVGLGRSERRSGDDTPATLSGRVSGEYPWGSRWPPPEGAGNYSDQTRRELAPGSGSSYIEGYADGFPGTSPVMSFEPNRYGLFDLGGNVWEWCEDWLGAVGDQRVLRGASWRNPREHTLRSSHRSGDRPEVRRDNNGFRVVLDLAPEE